MLDTDLKSNITVLNVDSDGSKVMYDFLELSARPDTSGKAVETHLLGSLAIALSARKVAN